MKIAFFNAKSYDIDFFNRANQDHRHEIVYFESRLTLQTAELVRGFQAICTFVNDRIDRELFKLIASHGVKLVALRSAGFNQVDLAAANEFGISVVRVPAYSPYAVAEHALALLLTLNRKTHRAHARIREGNFSIEGLLGFDLHGMTVGIVGTGKIGVCFAEIMRGFRCRLLAFDPVQNPEAVALGVEYVTWERLIGEASIISLHCPLIPSTKHLIDARAVEMMKRGVVLLNTSRGGLIDTAAVIGGLKSGQIGYLGLDVYEEESELFFEDHSDEVIQDDLFARLMTFPNVLMTGHQGFFTEQALHNIAETTLKNVSDFEKGIPCENEIRFQMVKK
jgi:D-lactate dehydrogenase